MVIDLKTGRRLLDRPQKAELVTLVASTYYGAGGLRWSPDGRYLLTYGGRLGVPVQGSVRANTFCVVWDLSRDGEVVPSIGTNPNSAFSPDSTLLAQADGDGIRIVRLADGAVLKRLEVTRDTGRSMSDQRTYNMNGNQLAFSPDGKRLAFVTSALAAGEGATQRSLQDYRLHLWDWESATPIWQSGSLVNPVGQLAFSPDGTRLVGHLTRFDASAGSDLLILMWDTRTAREVWSLPVPIPRFDLAFTDPHQISFVGRLGGVSFGTAPAPLNSVMWLIDATPVEDDGP